MGWVEFWKYGTTSHFIVEEATAAISYQWVPDTFAEHFQIPNQGIGPFHNLRWFVTQDVSNASLQFEHYIRRFYWDPKEGLLFHDHFSDFQVSPWGQGQVVFFCVGVEGGGGVLFDPRVQ